MNFLNKMERKFGRYAIHNLTKYMILCYIIGYALQYMQELFEVPLISYLYMSPYHILRGGQIWRLVSWLLIPPGSDNIFLCSDYADVLLFTGNHSGENLGSIPV